MMMNVQPVVVRTVLRKHLGSQPSSTLAYVDDDDDPAVGQVGITEEKYHQKPEKSVHFATEKLESVTDDDSSDALQTNRDALTWMPSEHLHHDDTFLSETQPENTVKESVDVTSQVDLTSQVYGTDTFIDLTSEDDTCTVSEGSQSVGRSSSQVFSSHSDTYREWRDVTEIVKDIAELEESEFVAHNASPDFPARQASEDSEVTGSWEADQVKGQFVQAQLRRLKLASVSSPRSLDSPSPRNARKSTQRLTGPEQRARSSFCQNLIEKCKSKSDIGDSGKRLAEPGTGKMADVVRASSLEEYGLNPAIVDRLRLHNLEAGLNKKLQLLEEDTKSSEEFLQHREEMEAMLARKDFVEHVQHRATADNMDNCIQAHLIKMHPVTWFADFVNELPRPDLDSWDVLYHYKTLLENRQNDS